MPNRPDTYRYPAEDLDKDFYVQLVAAWVQSRMEADRALLQLNGFLLAGTFVVLTTNGNGQLGPQEGWVFVAIFLSIAAAALVAALKESAVLIEHIMKSHQQDMTARHDRPIAALVARILAPEQTPAAEDAAMPNGQDAAANEAEAGASAVELGLAVLDRLAVAMLSLAGVLAGSMMLYKVF